LLWIGRAYLFADEDVRQGLVVVEQTTIGVDQKQIVIEFFGDIGGVFDLGEDVLEEGSFFGIGKDSPVLVEVDHGAYILLMKFIMASKLIHICNIAKNHSFFFLPHFPALLAYLSAKIKVK